MTQLRSVFYVPTQVLRGLVCACLCLRTRVRLCKCVYVCVAHINMECTFYSISIRVQRDESPINQPLRRIASFFSAAACTSEPSNSAQLTRLCYEAQYPIL
jgi:hypothetical protein